MEVSQDIATHFTDLRMKRTYRYLIVKMGETGPVLEHAGARDATFDMFRDHMPKDEPRWCLYDLEYTTTDGRKESKLVFCMYCPDMCLEQKVKFSYANAKNAVKEKMSPVNRELQVNDHADIKESEWIEECL